MTKENSTASDSATDADVTGSRQNWLLHAENAKAKSHPRSFHMKSAYQSVSKIWRSYSRTVRTRVSELVTFYDGYL